MKTQTSRKRRAAPRHRGVLPPGAVRLGCERLEERAFLAADVQFQNPDNQFDVNGDGAVNRFDVFALISEFRLGGERTLVPVSVELPSDSLSEGEAPTSSGGFIDVNGDNEFDRRDAFSLIGKLRSEGEQDPPGNPPVVLRYTIGIFQEINGQVVQLTDPDGAGPLGITVPENSNFLVRVFVQDTGAEPVGQQRNPGEEGIGQFALDLDYGVVGDTGTVTVVDTAAPAHFEGPEAPNDDNVDTPFNTPAGPVAPSYNAPDAADRRPGVDDQASTLIRNISSLAEVGNPINFLGANAILAFEVEMLAGPTAAGNSTVTIATRDFTGDPPANTFFNATQDNAWFANPVEFPNSPFAITNQFRVDDDLVTLSIVEDTFANPDVVILHELPATNAIVSPVIAIDPGTDLVNGVISIDVVANDFFPANPAGTSRAVTDIGPLLGGQGTAVINNNGTPGDLTDDFIDYTPPNPFFVTTTPVTFFYELSVVDPGGNLTGETAFGDVTIDLREFNFAPIVSAPGLDEALDPNDILDGTLDNRLTVRQGDTESYTRANLLGNDSTGDNPNAAAGINFNDTTDPLGEVQALHITGDPNFPTDPAFEPVVLVNGVVTPEAGTASVGAAGQLIFDSNPGFAVAAGPIGTVVTIRYFVEDDGLEQSLAGGVQPLVVTPKRTAQELNINVVDRPDLAAFTVEFFEDNAGAIGAGPLNEISVGAPFFAVVSIDVTDAGVLAGATGVQTAFADMRYDNLLVDTFTSPNNPVDITVDGVFAVGSGADTFPPDLIDDTGGSTVLNAVTTPQRLFVVHMQAQGPGVIPISTLTEFTTLFARNQGDNAPPAFEVFLNGLAAPLDEAQIGFGVGPLLLAVGNKPVANDDTYFITEDVTFSVSDTFAYTGAPVVVGATDPTLGVLQNDDDAIDAANPVPPPPNSIKAELLDTAGIVNGTLFLENPANPGTFIQVTGAGAQAPPANWNGGFRYVPNPTVGGVADFFTYRVIDKDLRLSDPARVDLVILGVDDNPVGVVDTYAVAAAPDVLTVDDEGNLTGQGGPAAAPPVRGVLNNDTDQDPGTALTAVLITEPAFGILEVEDPANPGQFIQINGPGGVGLGGVPAGWQGTFRYTPNAGVRGVIDTFLYRAVDNTGLESGDTTVNIEIDLANVTVEGRVWVDDSGGTPGTPPNGLFDFLNANATPEFDNGDLNIERTLGGVAMQLAGTSIVGQNNIAVNASSNSAGEFLMDQQLGGAPIPAGNYNLTTDVRLGAFFNAPVNNNDVVVDRTVADAIFGELGLKLQFINFNEYLASNRREGIYIGYDDTVGSTDPIVWYAIDRGPGWSIFDHQITGLTFVNGAARLTFTQENPGNPGVPDNFTVAVPTGNAFHYSEVRQGNLRVVHIMGTADELRSLFPAV